MTPGAIDAVPALGGGGGAVSSVNTRTGAVVLTAADVGAGQLPSGVLLPSGIIIPSGADISGILGTSGSKAAAGNDSRLSDARTPTAHKTSHEPGGSDALTLLDNSSLKAGAGIVLSKLATDPLARANHTGTQAMSTISDAGTLATKSAVVSADITDGTIVDGDINAAAAIAQSKISGLTTDLAAKAPSASPTFTGTVTIPAPAADLAAATKAYTDSIFHLQMAPSGALAFPFDRGSCGGTTRGVGTGTLYLTACWLVAGTVISNMNILPNATNTAATHTWMAIFDASRVLVATTNDDTAAAAMTAATVYTKPITQIASGASATYTVPTSALYYLGFMQAGTVVATVANPTSLNMQLVPPILAGSSTTGLTTRLTDFSTPQTAITASVYRDHIWPS